MEGGAELSGGRMAEALESRDWKERKKGCIVLYVKCKLMKIKRPTDQ